MSKSSLSAVSIVVLIAFTGVIFYPIVKAYTREPSNPVVSGARITVDKQTGCSYILRSRGITPRLNKDGKPMCSLN